jgi:hypothetical protein
MDWATAIKALGSYVRTVRHATANPWRTIDAWIRRDALRCRRGRQD